MYKKITDKKKKKLNFFRSIFKTYLVMKYFRICILITKNTLK